MKIIVTGASSGFGALTARALAKAGHTVYASMRDTTRWNARQVEEAKKFAKDNKVDLRAIELDVASQVSVDAAIQKIVGENKRLDVMIHNAATLVQVAALAEPSVKVEIEAIAHIGAAVHVRWQDRD